MIFGARLIVFIFLSTILITQYQNCSSYSDNTLFSNSLQSTTAPQDPSRVSISLKSYGDGLTVQQFDDQIQIGGTCNPGFHLKNYFEYHLSYTNSTGQRIEADVNKNAVGNDRKHLSDAVCENGRFYLVVPLLCPADGGPTNLVPSPSPEVKIILHTFDAIDASGQYTNYKRVDLTAYLNIPFLAPCK